jgi:hypothetical protein
MEVTLNQQPDLGEDSPVLLARVTVFSLPTGITHTYLDDSSV